MAVEDTISLSFELGESKTRMSENRSVACMST
jgi:hypothetical protein